MKADRVEQIETETGLQIRKAGQVPISDVIVDKSSDGNPVTRFIFYFAVPHGVDLGRHKYEVVVHEDLSNKKGSFLDRGAVNVFEVQLGGTLTFSAIITTTNPNAFYVPGAMGRVRNG